MFMRILFIFSVVFSLSVPSYAKSAKAKAKNYSKVPLTFNFDYYASLTSANRLKYLIQLNELVVKSAQYNDKMNGGKKTAMLLDFLLPSADAAKSCFSGGIAYSADKCGTLPSDLVGPVSTPPLGCASANMQRCSLAFGVAEGNSALCYDKSKEKNATTECNNLASSSGSIQRLKSRLDICKNTMPDVSCQKLIDALNKDTKSETFTAYCSARASKGYCKKTQASIAQLGLDSAGETTQTPSDDSTCAEADSKLYNSTLGGALGGTPNAKWQQLLEMSVKACGGSSVLNMDMQKDKLGMCVNVSSSGRTANPGDLQRAIQEVTNPSFADANSRNSPEVVKAFQEQFGLTPREFTQAFCAQDTRSFYDKINKLSDLTAASDKFNAGSYFGGLLSDKNLSQKIAAMPNNSFRTAFQGLLPLQQAKLNAEAAYKVKADSCKLQKDSGNYIDDACIEADRLKEAQVSATAAFNEKVKPVRSLTETLVGSFTATQTEAQRLDQLKKIKAQMGDANFTAVEKELMAEREFNLRGSTASQQALASRKELKDCLASAIKITEGPDHGPDVFTPNTNSGQNCRRVYVDNILAGGHSGMLRVKVLPTSSTDTSVTANQCFTADASVVTSRITIPNCKKAIKASNKNYTDKQICIDNPATLEVYAMKCSTVPGDTVIQDGGDGPER